MEWLDGPFLNPDCRDPPPPPFAFYGRSAASARGSKRDRRRRLLGILGKRSFPLPLAAFLALFGIFQIGPPFVEALPSIAPPFFAFPPVSRKKFRRRRSSRESTTSFSFFGPPQNFLGYLWSRRGRSLPSSFSDLFPGSPFLFSPFPGFGPAWQLEGCGRMSCSPAWLPLFLLLPGWVGSTGAACACFSPFSLPVLFVLQTADRCCQERIRVLSHG